MDNEVKQRNRRKRAQRMQAIRENKTNNDSGEEDENVIREKPQRPPNRRKKAKEPLVEEDIIDGFAILGFKTYEELETVLKIANKENVRRLVEIERIPKHEPRAHITHHISVHPTHTLTLTHDPATSDDSGRASERLTGSSVAPRDADSSRDRLSDASSRCSSGKGYICDSEGEDDKGSDASSVIFPSTPASRKHEFPGALPPSLPLNGNGTSSSPVPAPTPPNLPAPSPAPAQQPPQHPVAAVPAAASTTTCAPPNTYATPSSPHPPAASVPVVSVPVTMPQPAAAAPVAHHHPLESTPGANRTTDSPAVATSANAAVAPGTAQYHPSTYHHPHHHHQHHHHHHPPLYTPYAAASTVTAGSLPPPPSMGTMPAAAATVVTAAAAVTSHASSAVVAGANRGASPRGQSPARERESYSNVSSLSRSSVTTCSATAPSTTTVSSSLVMSNHPKVWNGPQSQQPPHSSPAPPRPTPPMHSFPAPMFTAPLPPPISTASPHTTAVPPAANSNPFSAENLFQPTTKKPNSGTLNAHHRVFISECATPSSQDLHPKYTQIPISNQADMLRRELDNRFLASQDRTLPVAPPPYLRTEMHQHQHHHTHVHQHTTSLLPPPPSSTLFPSPLYKDIPKLGGVDSPFYRQNIGMPNYPGYSPGLLHPGLTTGPTPFVPPNHLPTFQPKPNVPDAGKPKIVKTGKWNAMHVRVAWEIYHHQQKGDAKGATKTDLLRPPSHLFSPSVHHTRPHELPFPNHRTPAFEQPHPGSLFAAPPTHIGSTMSPFTRYGAGFAAPTNPANPFSMSPFASARDLPLGPLHDPWRGLQRTVPSFPGSMGALPPTLPGLGPPGPWTIKPDPILEQQREREEREQRERERLRREREERERREKEEKQRRLEQQQQMERERERREKERREHERRELEREREQRERDRERMLQQRYVESTKHLTPSIRDRSPMRNGTDASEIRVKEEPRTKEEELLSRTDPRYHPYLRHPATLAPPPSILDRSRVMAHYPPSVAHWPPHPDPYYRYEPLRYNPLVDAALRAEEEQRKLFGAYGPHPGHLRAKDPGLMHLRAGPGPPPPPSVHKLCATPPTDVHKKEEVPR